MSRKEHTKAYSDVEVTFLDGEVRKYRISASTAIGAYLAQQAGETGVLVLYNEDTSHGIPMSQIREYVLRPVTVEQLEHERAIAEAGAGA